MKLEWKIAWRYFFKKKKHNAINIISGVSAAGVAVVTAAMIIVLSVMNGFGSMVRQMFSTFDPQIKILPTTGKSFSTSSQRIQKLLQLSDIDIVTEVVEETGLAYFENRQVPAIIKGVDENFSQLTEIDSILLDGEFRLCDYYENDFGQQERVWERCVLGRGLANQIGAGAHFVSPITLYAPTRTGKVNTARPDKSFHEMNVFISGIFAVNQVKYDDYYLLVSLPLARQLFEYQADEVTALEIKLKPTANEKKVQKEMQNILGKEFQVLNRYEQQADFYKIMKVEKFLSTLLLVFILIIACFNIIGSLSMLVIDKKDDIEILRNLGAQSEQVQKIFLYEGWLVSLTGMVIGLVLGVTICLLQQIFGFVKLGTGMEYVISAYPVEVHVIDILIVMAVVTLIGFLTAWIPTRSLKTNKAVKLLVFCLPIFLASCNPTQKPVEQPMPKEFDKGWLQFYGAHYAENGIAQNVLSLDLYSTGIVFNDSTGRIEGNGWNLYFSDIFIPSQDTLLPTGFYSQDITATPLTFLPSIHYEGQYSGCYMIRIVDGAWDNQTIYLFDDGHFDLKYIGDTACFTFAMRTKETATEKSKDYVATAKGIFPTYDATK